MSDSRGSDWLVAVVGGAISIAFEIWFTIMFGDALALWRAAVGA